MAASPDDLDLEFMDWASELTPEDSPTDELWGELDALFAEPASTEWVDLDTEPPPTVEALFADPEVAPPAPARELTIPPLLSPQGLWAEIGHLFQTPAFEEAVPTDTADPTIEARIDALSQAMLANDGETIQALVHQIQQTYDDLLSIEIFLAATRNLCH